MLQDGSCENSTFSVARGIGPASRKTGIFHGRGSSGNDEEADGEEGGSCQRAESLVGYYEDPEGDKPAYEDREAISGGGTHLAAEHGSAEIRKGVCGSSEQRSRDSEKGGDDT